MNYIFGRGKKLLSFYSYGTCNLSRGAFLFDDTGYGVAIAGHNLGKHQNFKSRLHVVVTDGYCYYSSRLTEAFLFDIINYPISKGDAVIVIFRQANSIDYRAI
ncbi:MAG: hypothetical protein WAO23_07070 [Dethiobacteria bacterium]